MGNPVGGIGGPSPLEPQKRIEGEKGKKIKSSDLPRGTAKKEGIEAKHAIQGVEAKAGGHTAIAELKKMLGTEEVGEIKQALAEMVGKMDASELAENVGGLAKAVALSSEELGREYHAKMLDDLLKPENEDLLGRLIDGAIGTHPEEYLEDIRTIARKEE